MARLRNWLLLALAAGVLASWAGAGGTSRLLDSWAFYADFEADANNTINATFLSAPTLSSAVANPAVEPGTVTLTWTTAGDAATHIRIHRKSAACADAGSFAVVATVPESPASFADTGLAQGTYCYKVQSVIHNWTSPFSGTKQVLIESPISPDDLFLKSSGTTSDSCEATTNSLVTSGAAGGCRVESATNPPFEFATWCYASTVKASASGWTLTLVVDVSNPFQSATLMADLSLAGTVIASSGTFDILPNGAATMTAVVNLTPTGAVPPASGTLCLKITNVTEDSGASHHARIIQTGGSKVRGPWDPFP
ncbi:MAG TPA: hypothetical protein VNN10_12595 [Dehalococcoidia bacterium]|nr:hypothetical protein [Dehalococcoidia bacterium]